MALSYLTHLAASKELNFHRFDQLRRACDDFIVHLQEEDNALDSSTIQNYDFCLKKFCVYVGVYRANNVGPGNITKDLCIAYMKWIKDEKLGETSHRIINAVALRKLFSWLHETGIIRMNPLAGWKGPKAPRLLPRPVSKDVVKKLLDAPPTFTAGGIQDRAVMEILYGSGLRISECLNLMFECFNFEGNGFGPEISFIGKNKKYRTVPLTTEAVKAIGRHIRYRGWGQAKDYLFPSPSNSSRPFCKIAFAASMRDYVSATGIEERVTPHQLRHSFATHLLAAGVTIDVIRELLGHSNLNSTQIYTKVMMPNAFRQYRAANIRGDL